MEVKHADGSPVRIEDYEPHLKGVDVARNLAEREIVVATSILQDFYKLRPSKAKIAEAKALKAFAERILEALS